MNRSSAATFLALGIALPPGDALGHHGWAWTTGEQYRAHRGDRGGPPRQPARPPRGGRRGRDLDGRGRPALAQRARRPEGRRPRPRRRDPGDRRARGRPRRTAAQGRAAVSGDTRVPALPRARLSPLEALLAGAGSHGGRPDAARLALALRRDQRRPRAWHRTPGRRHPATGPAPARLLARRSTAPQLVRVLVPVAATGLGARGGRRRSAVLGPGARVCRRRLPAARSSRSSALGTLGALALHRAHGFLLESASEFTPRGPCRAVAAMLAGGAALRPPDRFRGRLSGSAPNTGQERLSGTGVDLARARCLTARRPSGPE